MVEDLKNYGSKAANRAKSPIWVILLISHTTIFVLGVFLGHWTGGRFADVSSPKKVISEGEAPAGKDSESRGKDTVSDRVVANGEVGGDLSPSDQQGEEVQFTFYESLKDGSLAGPKKPVRVEEAEGHTQDTSTDPRGVERMSKERAPASASTLYYVQIASFREEERARKFAEDLKGGGHPTEVVSKVLTDKGIWYRVRMGPFEDEREAQEKAGDLRKAEKLQPLVVSESREQD
jgi:cell division septation protein DedD